MRVSVRLQARATGRGFLDESGLKLHQPASIPKPFDRTRARYPIESGRLRRLGQVTRLHSLFDSQHLVRRRTISSATDAPWSIKITQLESQVSVQLDDSWCRLVGNHHRPGMSRQPLRSSLLIFPRKATRTVRRELNVVRRVCVHEICCVDRHLFYVDVRKLPLLERARMSGEI